MKNINLIERRIYKDLLGLFIPFLTLLLSCPVAGQEQPKKLLTEADYGRWGTLSTKDISDQGKWSSYEMTYENHNDTLFLQRTSGNERYSFPKGRDSHFGGEKIFAFLQPESKLKVIHLETLKTEVLTAVKRYEVVLEGKYILTLDSGYGEKSILKVRNEKGNVIDSILGVTEYALNNTKDAVLFATNNQGYDEVGIINFKKYSRFMVSKGSTGEFHNLAWQKNGKSVAFLNETDSVSKTTTIHCFRIAGKKLFSFDYSAKVGSTDNLAIYNGTPLSISHDGTKVFFMEAKKKDPEVKKDPKSVEVWNGNDKWLYIDRQQWGDIPKLAVWYPDTDWYSQINSNELPHIMLSGQQDYAISYNKNAYGLQPKYYEEIDYYLKNIKDGSQNLMLKKQSCDPNQMGFDPSNNKILYYRESNWWIYDPIKETHTNLTRKVTTKWDNSSNTDAPHQFMAYGNPGWSSDGKNVLLYDANDIWLVAIDGSNCTRLTKGREKSIVFRIAQIEYDGFSWVNYNGRAPATIDMSKDLILEAENTENWSTGYFIYNSKSGEKPLIYGASKMDEIRKSKNSLYIFQNQTFNQPPRLKFRKRNDSNAKVLFESNKQQKEYYFGKSELLYYTNSAGQKLKAALFYPANYNPAKKYPMVVHIYDSMSKNLYHYVKPSLLNREGFNSTNYTLNGYFVLLPDIAYKMGDPGVSAVDCVTAAVNTVLDKGLVDKSKIGLFGHSFGGYETNFIISQTPIFAAAVSGAGISDIISFYFNISKNGIFQSDMWRFENQQWRMGKSLYDDKEGYCRNSPIMHAENVKTPLLLWTGKNDRIVPWNQSISYYLALRRLGVKNRLLVYPNEDHSLENAENQTDLSKRMMAWFDHLLKGKPVQEWISKEVSAD
ncbi:S9 family peptidase [Flavobacterium ranwuense]|uniref:S9 family peptidase n=1 Tax=Flavobacterium ranwuense TaxID=2541725 RepID=A0ABY2DRK6_9FLAO|nr:prolyl oligopeptidase family serine peptidase [Flavobacterium ranwuense]TDE29400.1 S9 family peptidase [Flavobacterium ranwuense]